MTEQGFKADPLLRLKTHPPIAILAEDFSYTDKLGIEHIAHKGMPTDGASIPRFLWRVIGPPMFSNYLPAAIIHDKYCYCAADAFAAGNKKDAKAVRLKADQLFYEILLYLEISKTKAWIMYRGVRIGARSMK